MQRSPEVEAELEDLRVSPIPREMRELVERASPEQLAFRPAPGEWSIVEILRHLGDNEAMRHLRLDRILAEDNPILTVPTPTPGERESEDALVLLARWECLRAQLYDRLNAMSEEEWRRGGTQAPDPQVNRTVNEPTTILIQATRINHHAARHLEQMRENLEACQRRQSS